MGWLLELLFEAIRELCSQFIVDMMDIASSMFTEILSCDLNLFEELFGVVGDLYLNAVLPIAIALLLMILTWQVFKSMFGKLVSNSEDPMELVFRSALCLFMVMYAKDIVNYILEIVGTPYQWVVGTDITVNSFSGYVSAAEAVVSVLGVDAISISLLLLIMHFVVAWNYFKLLFILAERYVLLGVFSYTAPLAFATGGAKATNNILASWTKMFGGQVLLVILDAWCLKMFLSGYGNLMASGYGFTKFFAATMCLIGFCKIAGKLDSYMASMGVSMGRTIDRTVSVTYDAAGNMTKVLRQGKGGESWELQYDYDLKNRITHVEDCLGPVFQYEYDKNDRLVKEILPQAEKCQDENAYHYSYNYRGDILTLQDSKSITLEHNTYNSDGQLTSTTQANGNEATFTYNLLGGVNEITTTRSRQAEVAAQSYRYDSRGRIIGVTNGNQHDTAYGMDNWGRITKSKNPDGGKEGYTYDYAGNITSTIDGNGNTITYRYNSQGKVCETIDQDGNSERFYYDREGRLSLYIDRLGTHRCTTYNMDNNLVLEVAADADEKRRETRTYEYDTIGNLKKSAAGGFVYQYRHRPDGKLLEKISSGKKLLTCTYHADGSLKSLTDLTGKTVFYGYDWRGKLASITDESDLEIVHYDHYEDGKLKEINHFNGIKTLYNYDTDGNITRLLTVRKDGSALCDLQYEYDLNGNRTAKAGSMLMPGEKSLKDTIIRYRYDSMERLLEEEHNGETNVYQYDWCGNRLSHKQFDCEELYRYNKRNQLISRSTAEGSVSYTYNAQGNVMEEAGREGNTTYGYSLFNRQSYVKTADGQTLESLYDGEGLRAGTIENGKKSTFLYYNGELLGKEQEDSADRLILGYGVAASEQSGTHGYHAYHLDEQISTGYITNTVGQVENSYSYDAFGRICTKEENIHNRILYTGQQYDQVSGQHYLRARFYNPTVGRFLQEDEYRGDGLNLYAYCANNPVVYYDPSGFEACDGQDAANSNPKKAGQDVEVVGELEYIHRQKTGKETDIPDLERQVQQQIGGFNKIIQDEGMSGLKDRINNYSPEVEAEGRSHVKTLVPAPAGEAHLHVPDMKTGGKPTDVGGTGNRRNNSIIGGQAGRISKDILGMSDDTTKIVGKLTVKGAK